MKKLISFLLAVLMLFALAACGSKNDTTSGKTDADLSTDESANIGEHNDEDQVFYRKTFRTKQFNRFVHTMIISPCIR